MGTARPRHYRFCLATSVPGNSASIAALFSHPSLCRRRDPGSDLLTEFEPGEMAALGVPPPLAGTRIPTSVPAAPAPSAHIGPSDSPPDTPESTLLFHTFPPIARLRGRDPPLVRVFGAGLDTGFGAGAGFSSCIYISIRRRTSSGSGSAPHAGKLVSPTTIPHPIQLHPLRMIITYTGCCYVLRSAGQTRSQRPVFRALRVPLA